VNPFLPDQPVHLEDLREGMVFRTAEQEVTADMIKAFAAQYDPQSMHLDEAAAEASMFGRLIGSGWQTLVLTMRLMVQARPLGSTPLIGLGVDRVRFAKPLMPGTTLHVEARVVGTRRFTAGDRGAVTLDLRTLDEAGAALVTQRWTVLAPVREARDG